MTADLQRLYRQVVDEENERYRGWGNPTGYQARCAEEVGRRIGTVLIEYDDLWRRLNRRWPSGASDEWREVMECLRNLPPAIIGTTKKFYVLRDALRAVRHVERARCAICGKRYDGWREPNEPDWRNRWRNYVYPINPGRRPPRQQWSCSWPCFRKAQKQLERELKWIKTANQRIKEARKLIRRVAQNPVAPQSSDARN